MIAKVRIAPIEQWCEPCRNGHPPEECLPLVGMEVEIITESMVRDTRCPDGMSWQITEDSKQRGFHALGIFNVPPIPWLLCQHMLEMD